MVLPLQTLATTAIERVLNSLPAGLLVALLAWALLRLLPKQNSRTRFVVWFAALLAVAVIPLAGGFLHRSMASTLFQGTAAFSLPASWAGALFVVWALAVCVMMARLALGIWRLRELRRTCKPVDTNNLDSSLRALIAELNTNSFPSRPVTLATSNRLRVPAAIGLWQPMVVLPTWTLRELPVSDLDIILRHEFAHLQHWDDWTNLVQKLVRVLFFFHPAVWWIEKRLSVEREMACDDVVVAQTANPTGYASCLVSLLERSLAERGWSMAHALVHRAREASMRLARILDKNRPLTTRVSKPALVLIGALTVMCVAMLPNTREMVSFEKGAPAAGDHPYSAAMNSPVLSEPALISSAMVHHADLPSSMAGPMASPAASPAKYKERTRNDAVSSSGKPLKTVPADSAISADARGKEPSAVPAHENAGDMIAENSFAAAVYKSFLDEGELAGLQAEQPAPAALPTVVLVHATQFVELDSSVVWHVQIWHVTFVNATWERKAAAPTAHST